MQSFFAELKQRRVIRAAIGYVVLAAGTLQFANLVLSAFHAPSWVLPTFVVLAAAGFPPILVIAWIFDLRGASFRRTQEPTGTELTSRRRLWGVCAIGAFAAGGAVCLWLTMRTGPKPFDSSTMGVLVLRISGDDESRSLQRDLVSSLDSALASKPDMRNVKVRAAQDEITEQRDFDQANHRASEIAKKFHAALVIWGERIAQHKFHPRLTTSEEWPFMRQMSKRGLRAQNLAAGLPEEFVNRPVALLEVIQGAHLLVSGDVKAASAHFEAALAEPSVEQSEAPGIASMAALCHLQRALAGDERTQSLNRAIELFERAATSANLSSCEAGTMWLDAAKCYGFKTTGLRQETIRRRFAAASKAVELSGKCEERLTKIDAIIERAAAYCDTNAADAYPKAISDLEVVIRDIGRPQNSIENHLYSSAHFDLAAALSQVGSDKSKANITKALAAAAEAREHIGEDDLYDLAAVQNLIGSLHMRTMRSIEDLDGQAALAAFNEVKRLARKQNSAVLYSAACFEIGTLYSEYQRDDRDLAVAIAELDDCLSNRDRAERPDEWATAKVNFAVAHLRCRSDTKRHLLAALGALEDVTNLQDGSIADDVRCAAEVNLGLTYLQVPSGDAARDAEAAKKHFKSALNRCQDENRPLYRDYLRHTEEILNSSR